MIKEDAQSNKEINCFYILESMGRENHTDLGAEFTWNISLVWSRKTWSGEYKTHVNTYCGMVFFLNHMLFDELL